MSSSSKSIKTTAFVDHARELAGTHEKNIEISRGGLELSRHILI